MEWVMSLMLSVQSQSADIWQQIFIWEAVLIPVVVTTVSIIIWLQRLSSRLESDVGHLRYRLDASEQKSAKEFLELSECLQRLEKERYNQYKDMMERVDKIAQNQYHLMGRLGVEPVK